MWLRKHVMHQSQENRFITYETSRSVMFGLVHLEDISNLQFPEKRGAPGITKLATANGERWHTGSLKSPANIPSQTTQRCFGV